MTTVYVERKYKQAFESICELLRDGFLADKHDGNDFVSAYTDRDGKSIIDGEYKYVLGTEDSEAEERGAEESSSAGFGWFAGVRDYKKVSQKSRWEALMENVSRTYHKLYSLVEYKEKKSSVAEEIALSSCREIVRKLYKTFLPDRADGAEVRSCEDKAMDDFYGVTLKTDISGSTGASVPILCKAYFRRVEGRLVPVTRDDAVDIDNYLAECVEAAALSRNEAITTEPIAAKDDIIFGTIDAVDKLLKSHDGISFEDAMFYAGREDEEEITRLVSQTAHDGATLKVVAAKILGISHVRWSTHLYDVYEYGEKTYTVSLGLNDMITMRCCGCGTTVINKNELTYTDSGREVTCVLSPKLNDFGLTEAEIKKIYANKVFKKHNYRLTCPDNFRNPHCTRYVCLTEDRVFTHESNGEIVYHCKTCPYAEIAYTDGKGKKHYTPTLVYACDVRDMVDASTVHQCEVCGRNIVGESERCPLCESISFASNSAAARTLYKKYRGMLPISTRMSSSSDRRAYEDSEIILFCINKKRYIVYKAKLKESGLNDKPKRIDG
ncbi:MAG: hypothetical protein J1F39_02635 [Clostridiales bacterium]|nr:hypothetical protein [Clostridiales bacterium]